MASSVDCGGMHKDACVGMVLILDSAQENLTHCNEFNLTALLTISSRFKMIG